MQRFAARFALVMIFAILTLPFTGCDEDCSTEPEDHATGQITGRITAPGITVEARVYAERVEDPLYPDCGCPSTSVEVDSSGAFGISVLPGRYVIAVGTTGAFGYVYGYLSHGSLGRTDVDTLVVGAGDDPVRADLVFGAARIELATPAAFDGETLRTILAGQDSQVNVQISAIARPYEGLAVFYFPAVPAGNYRMIFSTANASWLPGGSTEEEGAGIAVEAGRESSYGTTLPTPATLRGTITGSWQELNLSRPYFTLVGADSMVIAEARAGEDGSYTVNVFGPVRARLLISIKGVVRWQGGNSFETATEFDLQPSQQTEVNIVESAIAGDLGQTAEFYLDAPIRLCDASGKVIAGASTGYGTDMFYFPNLVPGTYFIYIPRGPTWIDHWYDGADTFEQATPVEITSEGQVRWIYPALMPGASISGTVIDSQGRPIVGVLVRVTPGDDTGWIYDYRDLTGPAGTFEIRRFSDGSYKLGASLYSDVVWYPSAASWDSAGTVTIQGHEDVTGIVIRFNR